MNNHPPFFVLSTPATTHYLASKTINILHLAQAKKIIETHEPIDISFWKKNGDIVEAVNVVCTSSNFKNNTFNFKWLGSNTI